MSMPSPEIFEKLSSFYLGREYDPGERELLDDLMLYDARDLCTHAMCVGMTGSGKTGLCLTLLEEAALDGIPAICVDPKGDLANLLLTFPEMQGSDFLPWIEPSEAARKGLTPEVYAEQVAETWKSGLASWGQGLDRVTRFRNAVDIAVYTPGSNIGLPMTVLKSFDAPPTELFGDADAMRERVTGAASGLLTLLGIDADPLLSPEHILVSTILEQFWRARQNVSVGDLVRLIQSPPIERVGVIDLESFMPTDDRVQLAMRLNNLLASPAFSTWLEGESLSIQRLLYSDHGQPRLSILSLAHLSDSERMFFVTILLNELLAWVRTQSGTNSLRAIFYMDEVAGYFPPSAIPPSKPPMLTLLKQARAYGLGIMLATQNPVDLDYKGLANIGTWFLGRLQTERDKARVLEGLEGAAVQTGHRFDRGKMEQMLASLDKRVFLMNNVHDDAPTLFQTRWAMSYLAGPLARDQISALMADRKRQPPPVTATERMATTVSASHTLASSRPVVPGGVEERFARLDQPLPSEGTIVYQPSIYASGSMHYVRASANLDTWIDVARLARFDAASGNPWLTSEPAADDLVLEEKPEPGVAFAELPDPWRNAQYFKSLGKQFKDYLYRHQPLTLYKSTLLKQYAEAGFDEASARLSLGTAAREARDVAMDELRSRYAKKMKSLDERLRSTEQRVAKEQSEANQAWLAPAVSFAGTLVGALVGRKVVSRSTVSRVESAVRSAGRASKQRGDVRRAEEKLESLALEMKALDEELREELEELAQRYDVRHLELEAMTLPPRKGDLKTTPPILVWIPENIGSTRIASELDLERIR